MARVRVGVRERERREGTCRDVEPGEEGVGPGVREDRDLVEAVGCCAPFHS